MIEVKSIRRSDWNSCSKDLQELESLIDYPYGYDFFHINHGSSYFRFFERLGEPTFHVAVDGDKVIACAAGVLRQLPDYNSLSTWYLCDLKVHPSYRGQHIPSKLFRRKLFSHYLKCGRGYAISMNPANSPNKVIPLIQKLSWLNFAVPGQLNIYSLNFEQVRQLRQPISKLVGPISFLSLAGKKDLIMKSTQRPLNVLHIQHGPFAERQQQEPHQDAVHMICAIAGSPLDHLLQSQQKPSASASIISHRMNHINWNFILTSDI